MNNISFILLHSLILSTLLAIAHSLLKWVAVQGQKSYLETLQTYWLYIALSLMLFGVIFFYYVFILRQAPISLLYPVYTGMSILFVLIAGRLLFGELIVVQQVVGAVFIIAGIILMGRC